MKAIVLYYSKSGKTKALAEKIAAATDADIISIEPEKAYGSYISSILRVAKENFTGKKPEFKTEIPNLSYYDAVFAGFPIWYNTVPVLVSKFLNNCNLADKILIPFATASVSTIDKSLKDIKLVAKGARIAAPYCESAKSSFNFDKWMKEVKSLMP